MNEKLKIAINEATQGSLHWYTLDFANLMNSIAVTASKSDELDKQDLENLYGVIFLSNILYNNTEIEMLPLEDGIYDLCVSKYNALTGGMSPVGAQPIVFDSKEVDKINSMASNIDSGEIIEVYKKIDHMDEYPIDKTVYLNTLIRRWYADGDDWSLNLQSKKSVSVSQYDNTLVGTLDKCKFVTQYEAAQYGIAFNDDSVGIFERDFMHNIESKGFALDELIAEIKYDGVSVIVVVDGDTIVQAYSRGDTQNNEAADLTPIFGGLRFPNATGKIDNGQIFAIKCECIITYDNLMLLSQEYGRSYANARNAVTGLIGSLDGRKYVKYLTLVPITTSGLDILDRVVEIEFLNKYYTFGIDLKYWVLRGAHDVLLYSVHNLVKQLEDIRGSMPYMYDGVVISVTSNIIKLHMGRVNSVDKWAIAIKFNSQIKKTVFLGYSYSVGQNGIITPKAHFRPVEFLGTIHDNTTAHSYQRFKQLGLKVGDIVTIEYRNDVICYINKADSQFNIANPNPVIEFPTECPECGSKLVFSDKSASCPNIRCKGRNLGRIVNMLSKLNVKDFSDAYVESLGITSLTSFLKYDINEAKRILGDVLGDKLYEKIQQVLTSRYPDYRIVGALGFSSVAQEKWKVILTGLRLESIINMEDEELYHLLQSMNGIGSTTARVVAEERHILMEDLIMISNMPNVYRSFGCVENKPEVRFTGVRDAALEQAFCNAGYDADGKKSVTKKTSILIIPYMGFTSSKTSKLSSTSMVMTPDMARAYLSNIK